MEETPPTVYIVDDDEAVRDSLQMMLEAHGIRCSNFSSADAFLAQYHADMSGCLVLDIRMPGTNGMDLQKALNSMNAMLPVIFVTGHGDVPLAVEAMQQGAVDFIQKPYSEQLLLEKIETALALDARSRASLQQRQQIEKRIAELTPRERSVMELMVQGKANKVIAFDLEISQRTVEIHRARVMEKLQATSLAHLVRMYLAVEEQGDD